VTHCSQDESGNAIERLLFESVINALGQKQNDKYIIQYLILLDGTILAVTSNVARYVFKGGLTV
jgi:hypothetical protein